MNNFQKKKIVSWIDSIGEIIVYFFVFSIFIDSKATLKIGYALQTMAGLKLLFSWREIQWKGKEIYHTFLIIFCLGILFNIFTSHANGVKNFADVNIKFINGIMFLLFIDTKEKIKRVFYIMSFGGLCLCTGIIFHISWIRLDIIHQRAVLVLITTFMVGYFFESFRRMITEKEKKELIHTVFSCLLLCIYIKAIEVSGSRMALFSILASSAVYFIMLIIQTKFSLKIIIACFLVVFLGSVSFYYFGDKTYKEHVKTSFNTQTNMSNVYRIIMWKGAMKAYLSSPIFGVGSSIQDTGPYIYSAATEYQNISRVKEDFLENSRFTEAHSMYFNWLSQVGLLSLAYIYLFFYQLPKRFWKHKKSKLAFASFLGIIGFLSYGFSWSVWMFYGLIQKFFHILIALLIVTGEIGEEK